jgi:hypothetical protein
MEGVIMTKDELKNLFAFPTPTTEKLTVIDEVRKQSLKMAGTMLVNSPGSPEQTIAIRKMHEALMHFNLAVRLEKLFGAG